MLSNTLLTAYVALVGLIIGSAINAIVWRLYVGRSWVKGRSMCPECKHELGAKDLVPVISWLMLRGRCRYCKAKIHWQYPVVELASGRVLISSQNHGFAVDESSLPENLKATHRSLFDGSLQGVARTDCAAFSFQGHPEASPGPHEVAPLFETFTQAMLQRLQMQLRALRASRKQAAEG